MPIKYTHHKTDFAALVMLSILWTPITIAKPAGVIAYVSSSIDNKQIRLVNPDGSQDRLLWKVPISAGVADRIGSLSWQHDFLDGQDDDKLTMNGLCHKSLPILALP